MESSEKIIKNCDALQLIFRYFDIKEHLKLMKICSQFEYAIVHGVWRFLYKNLLIWQKSPDIFLLNFKAVNDVVTKYSVTYKEFHTILHHSSMYIRKMESNKLCCLENIISLKYHHLTELLISNTILDDTYLQQVAENCINLQSLSLINFTNSERESNILASVFARMKALNKLEINDIHFTAWKYFDVEQLFCLVHLKTLIIDINISDSKDNNGSNKNSTDCVYNIENLSIGVLPYVQSLCFIENLIRFESLIKLTLTSKARNILSLDDNILTQINNGCPKLCELSFSGGNFTFKAFPRMNNLKHLTFKWCKNISFQNFYEIFQKLEVKSLSLMEVEITDELEDIFNYDYTSDTLEALTIKDRFDGKIVRTFFYQQHKFEKVSKVTILKNYALLSQASALYFSHNFPNLKELIMESFCISSEDILYLEHLKVIKFRLFDNMSWSYLEILFRHPTLTHITITPFDCLGFEMSYEHFPECCEGLTTTLEYLCLPSVVYEMVLNFWPSFRQSNKLLKLEIVDCDRLKRRPNLCCTYID